MKISITQIITEAIEILFANKWLVLGLIAVMTVSASMVTVFGATESYTAYVEPDVKVAFDEGTIRPADVFIWDLGYEGEKEYVALEVPASGNELWSNIDGVVSTVLLLAFMFISLYFARNKSKKGGSYTPKEILFTLLTTIVVMFVFGIGLVLLIIPGIYFIIIFYFAPYYSLDYGVGPIKAMGLSRRAVSGNFWSVFWIAFLPVIGMIAVLVAFLVYVLMTSAVAGAAALWLAYAGMTMITIFFIALSFVGIQMAAQAHVKLDVLKEEQKQEKEG